MLLRKQDQFEPGSNFGAWATRVAYLEACSFHRKRASAKCFNAGDRLLESLASTAESNWNENADTLAALSHCFSRLSEDDRRLIGWRYRKNESSKEISARTGRTPDAIRQVLYRIRTELLNCIQHRIAEGEMPR